jgi:predicted MFS family arabinose efflux permease
LKTGFTFGTVVAVPLSGILADNFGWESIFYFFGGAAMIESILWAFYIHEAPHNHPTISEVT